MHPLGTKPLANVMLTVAQLQGDIDARDLDGTAVIVLGATQILGGAKLFPASLPGKVEAREVWAIGDLDGAHWIKLLPDVDLHVVAPQIADCARHTISRFASAATVEVQREVDRRAGLESAIRIMVQEIPGAALRTIQHPSGG